MEAKASGIIRLDGADNVVVALGAIAAGEAPESEGIAARQDIPAGHKMATADIAVGEPVRKFNQIIGFASQAIRPGEPVHNHNCAFQGFERDYAYGTLAAPTDFVADSERATFQGYRRANGRIGTRNYIGVLSSVNCSATVVHRIADGINRSGILDQYPNIDGVAAFTHGSGCCMDPKDEGFGVRFGSWPCKTVGWDIRSE